MLRYRPTVGEAHVKLSHCWAENMYSAVCAHHSWVSQVSPPTHRPMWLLRWPSGGGRFSTETATTICSDSRSTCQYVGNVSVMSKKIPVLPSFAAVLHGGVVQVTLCPIMG